MNSYRFIFLTLLICLSVNFLAGDYEDAIGTIVTYIDGTYNTPITNMEASKNLFEVLKDHKLTIDQKTKKLRSIYKRAFEDKRIPSRACYPDGLYALGKRYMTGTGVSKDISEGITWYTLAAENGSPKAQFELWTCYRDGVGVSTNDEEALSCLQKAAALDYAPALIVLGKLYLGGIGVPRDKVKGSELFRRAAEQGDPNGQYCLGYYYLHMTDDDDDDERSTPYKEKGLELLKKSAEQGNSEALTLYNDYR
jgi:uncharacterized protein